MNNNTREQLEAARAARLLKKVQANNKEQPELDETIEAAIATLQVNRGHIGAFVLVVVGKAESAIVDPQDVDASDGVTMRGSLNRSYGRILHTHLQDLIER